MAKNIIHKLFVELGVISDKLKSGFRKAENDTSDFAKSIKKINKLIAKAFTVSKVIQFGSEAHRLAGEMQGVKQAFDNLDSPGLLDNLIKSTRGTVSNLDLMKSAVRADNFKIPLDQLGKLFEFAHKRALQTGESVDYLVNSIVMGIGRKSPLILDNLGISAVELREKLKGVGTESASIGQIAEVVGGIADRELKKMGDNAITSKEKTEQLRAAWKNFLTTFGEETAPVIDKIKTALTNMFSALTETRTIMVKLNEAMDMYGDEMSFVQKEAILLAARHGVLTNKASELIRQYEKYLEQQEKINKATEGVNDDTEDQIGIIQKLKEEIKALNEELVNATSRERIIEINIKLKNKQKELDDLSELGLPKDVKRKELKMPPTKSGDEKISTMFSATESKLFGDIESEMENNQRAIDSYFDDYNRQIERTSENLQKLSSMTEKIGNVFMESFSQAEDGVENLGKSILRSVAKTLKAYTAEAIAGAVKNALASVPFPLNLAIAAAAGTTAGALMNSIIPSFANEGQANRPMMAMVGDYPGAQTNPEFMLKQSTLNNLIKSGGGKLSGEFMLKGENLVLAVNRANEKLNSRGFDL